PVAEHRGCSACLPPCGCRESRQRQHCDGLQRQGRQLPHCSEHQIRMGHRLSASDHDARRIRQEPMEGPAMTTTKIKAFKISPRNSTRNSPMSRPKKADEYLTLVMAFPPRPIRDGAQYDQTVSEMN